MTTCTWIPRSSSCGIMDSSSRYRTSGSPPTMDRCKGRMPVDQFQHTVDELLALSIAQAAQGRAATQMSVVVGITSWTLQRTLTGNLDRERGALSFENLAPCTNHFGSFHENPFKSDFGCANRRSRCPSSRSVSQRPRAERTAARIGNPSTTIGETACAGLALPEVMNPPPVG